MDPKPMHQPFQDAPFDGNQAKTPANRARLAPTPCAELQNKQEGVEGARERLARSHRALEVVEARDGRVGVGVGLAEVELRLAGDDAQAQDVVPVPSEALDGVPLHDARLLCPYSPTWTGKTSKRLSGCAPAASEERMVRDASMSYG